MKSVVILFLFAFSAAAANWPAWRGADASGVSGDQGFPLSFSSTENIVWKTHLPGPGNSTPIVWGKRVFVTGALQNGARRTVMCFDRADGHLLWQSEIAFEGGEATHKDNPYCSASPATDGERVYAWHGSAGMVAYDFDGKEVWRRDLGKFNHQWGNASSPQLFNDLLIAYCGPGLNAFIVALDKKDGKEVWRIALAEAQSKTAQEFFGSWSTPLIRNFNGKDELIAGLPKKLVAYDLATRKELWNCGGLGPLVYTNPVASGDTVMALSGYGGPGLAVTDGGSGDVTATHRLWLESKGIPQRVGSAVVVGEHYYIFNDSGFAQCNELKTNKPVWKERLNGSTWSSMVVAEGKIYATAMNGTVFVLKAEPKFELLHSNVLGELTRASPALSDGQIFIRTYENLYCFGKK